MTRKHVAQVALVVAALACNITTANAQAGPDTTHRSYEKVLTEAHAIYGSTSLSLSPDARWLAMVMSDSVLVVSSSGGAPTRLPLAGPHTCTLPQWDSRSLTMAIVCSP